MSRSTDLCISILPVNSQLSNSPLRLLLLGTVKRAVACLKSASRGSRLMETRYLQMYACFLVHTLKGVQLPSEREDLDNGGVKLCPNSVRK